MKRLFLVEWAYLGLMEYEQAFKLQIQLSENLLRQSEKSGYLLFLEHPHTITLGYSLKGDEGKAELRVSEEFLKTQGIKLFRTDRGGKATYHGPGQLIIYPVLNLSHFNFSGKYYVNKLEQVVINWLQAKGIQAQRDPDYPGVWVGEKKIASVGVRIEKRVSRHGIAINLWPELSYFDLIIPCGIKHRQVSSYFQLTGKKFKMEQGISELLKEFEKVFEMKLQVWDKLVPQGEGGLDDNQGMADARAV